MEMKISSREDAMGSFIYAMVHDHLLDVVTSSIRKLQDYSWWKMIVINL